MQTGYPPIRRVVTGHDRAHVAKVLLDGPATNAKHPQPGLVSTMLWCTDGARAAIPIHALLRGDLDQAAGAVAVA